MRERLLLVWKKRVEQYAREQTRKKYGVAQMKDLCIDRISCYCHPLHQTPQGEQDIKDDEEEEEIISHSNTVDETCPSL